MENTNIRVGTNETPNSEHAAEKTVNKSYIGKMSAIHSYVTLRYVPTHFIEPSEFGTAVLSDLHWQTPSKQIVSNNICSHCSLKKHASLTLLAEKKIDKII